MKYLKLYRKKILAKKYNNKLDLSKIQYFCLFLGHDRSGSTLVASILNAHKQALISIEENILKLVLKNFNKEQIYKLIEYNSYRYIYSLHNNWTGYSYHIPGISYDKNDIVVIGDKKAGVTTKLIGKYDFLLSKLEKMILLPIKIIIVIRNPYDNISTLTKNDKKITSFRSTKKILREKINKYFYYSKIIDQMLKSKKYDILIIYHEKLIKNPKHEITRLLNFLSLEADDKFLESTSKIIYKYPNASRYDTLWEKENILEVSKKLKNFSFINHYKYE